MSSDFFICFNPNELSKKRQQKKLKQAISRVLYLILLRRKKNQTIVIYLGLLLPRDSSEPLFAANYGFALAPGRVYHIHCVSAG